MWALAAGGAEAADVAPDEPPYLGGLMEQVIAGRTIQVLQASGEQEMGFGLVE